MSPMETAPKNRPILIHFRGYQANLSRWVVGYWSHPRELWASCETAASLTDYLPDGWVELPPG